MWWGSNLIKRKPSRQEIERRKAAQISPEYLALAEKAAKRMTDDYVRRWKRIKSDPAAQAFFEEAMRLSERILNTRMAVDVFEHVASIRHPQVLRTPGKRSGSNDPEGDTFLLVLLDEARKGKLPGQARTWSKTDLARNLNRVNPERWGTVSEIDRRLTRLINERNKRTKAKGGTD
jgi:hypothetical protein